MQTDKYYFFFKHQFGQWTQSPMVDNSGRTYSCCEQYMMFQKALLFGDLSSAEKIILEKDPSEQQRLGRGVENFDLNIWVNNRERVVYEGNILKFTQNALLNKRLLETFPLELVEASPVDKIWGIGMSINDPLIIDSKNWKGSNLIGKTLTRVRNDLILWNNL